MSEQPSEVLTGARRIFSVPSIYRFAQRAIGAEQLRSRLVTDLFQISAGDRILDLGCGPADILRTFEGRVHRVRPQCQLHRCRQEPLRRSRNVRSGWND